MDGPTPTAWDDLELEAKAVPEGEALSIRFRFDPKGPPPHTSVRALPLRRDEDLETQVVRHLEQQRASPGVWELRLMVNNKFRAQRVVRVEFPPPPAVAQDLHPTTTAEPGNATPAVGLTGPISGEEFLARAVGQIERAEELKETLRGVLGISDEDDEDEDEEEEAPPPPDPFWVQAVKSEKADLVFARVSTFMDGWLDAKLEEQRHRTAIARARAEQLGAIPPQPPQQQGPPQVRLHSVNGEPPKKAEG